MSKKPMSKKAAVLILVIVMAAAVFAGIVLLNRGDGPVMGMILSGGEIADTGAYTDAEKTHDNGTYLVVSSAFNQYQADYEADIPEGETLYAAVHFVECPQGSAFTAKWSRDGAVIAQEDGILSTGPEGVISYILDGAEVIGGSYTFVLYRDGDSLFEYSFSVK